MIFLTMLVAVAVLLLVLYPTIRASNERERLRREEALKPVSTVPFQSTPLPSGFGNTPGFVQPAPIGALKPPFTLEWEKKWPPGPNHPLGVHTEERLRLLSWLRCASAVLLNGGTWESTSREEAIRALDENWGVKNTRDFRTFHARVMALYTDGFGYVRYIGVLLTGIRAGYAEPEEMWPCLQAYARRIQRHHGSFDSLWSSYLQVYQAFARDSLPLAQTTDPEVRERIDNANRWRGRSVPFAQTFVDEAPDRPPAEWMNLLRERSKGPGLEALHARLLSHETSEPPHH